MLRYEHADFEDSPNNTEDFNFFLLDWGRPVGIGPYEKWRREVGL